MNISTQVAVVTALLSIVLGVLVWFRRDRTLTTLPFSLVCISVFVFCLAKVFLVFTGLGIYAQVSTAGALFCLAGFYYLLVTYLATEHKAIAISIIIFYALAAVGSVFRFIPRLDPIVALGENYGAYLASALIGVVAVGCLLLLGLRVISEPPGRQRRQLISLIAFSSTLAIVYVLEKIHRPTGPVETWTLFLLSLFLYFLYFSVVRYRYFGIRELAGKLVVLISSALFLSIIYGLLVYLIGTTLILFAFHTLVAAFLLLVLYEPVLSRLEQGTLRWLFRGRSRQRRSMGALARDLAGRISVEEVVRFLKRTVPQTLGLEGAEVYFYESNFFSKSGDENTTGKILESENLASWLHSEQGPLDLNRLRRQASDSYPGPERQRLIDLVQLVTSIPATVVIPIRHQDSVIGIWAINTGQGRELDRETVEVLTSLADQAALRVENARIYQRLRIQDRLATVGEMAAGLAHEIRNPLGSVKGAAEYLKDEPMPETSKEFVNIILEEAGRLNEVLRRFLDYARPFKTDIGEHDIAALIKRTAALILADEAAANIQIDIQVPESPVYGKVDAELFRQVIINLAKNAVEAMGKAGRLSLIVEEISGEILVRVEDEGPGISPENLDKLFEPFYTTKSGGSGLGLAISQRICEAHGAKLLVKSTPGKGTRFTVALPTESDSIE